MKEDLPIKNGIVILGSELEITASRSGGPGGQHVNKTDTRITVLWNVEKTNSLNETQKERVLQRLQTRLTKDGDLIVHNGESRSQQKNKEAALLQLAQEVRKALYVPKKRKATRVPKSVKESRLQSKAHRGKIKKMRKVKKEE
jgi:ribosome-associated protein